MTGLRERLILEVNILRCTCDDDADPMRRGGSESQLWHTLSASQVADWFLAAIEEEQVSDQRGWCSTHDMQHPACDPTVKEDNE